MRPIVTPRMRGGAAPRAAFVPAHAAGGASIAPPVSAPVAPRPSAMRPVWGIAQTWRSLTTGVEFSLVFVSFVVYLVGVVTSRISIGTVAMLGVAAGMLMQRHPIRLGWLGGTLVAFLAWCALGYFVTPYPSAVYLELVTLAKITAVIIGGVNALRSRAQIRFCLAMVLLAFAVYPARGAYFNRFLGGWGRVAWNGIYANPNDMAAISLIIIGFAAALAAAEGPGLLRTAARNVGIPVVALLIAFTQSRGALIALMAMAIVAFFRAPKHQRTRLLVSGAGVLVIFALFAPSSMWERLRGLKNVTDTQHLEQVDSEGSAVQRFEIWKVATRIIAEHPVFGVGLGGYPSAHQITAMRPEFKPTARGPRDTHSTYLNLLAETGIIGATIFVAMIVGVFRQAERARRAARFVDPPYALQLLWMETTVFAYGVAAIWGSFVKVHMTYVMLLILFALARVGPRRVGAGGPVAS